MRRLLWAIPILLITGAVVAQSTGRFDNFGPQKGGVSLTPWTSDIDADGYDLKDVTELQFRTSGSLSSLLSATSDGQLKLSNAAGTTYGTYGYTVGVTGDVGRLALGAGTYGFAYVAGGSNSMYAVTASTYGLGTTLGSTQNGSWSSTLLRLNSGHSIAWNSAANFASGSTDLVLRRSAAGVLQVNEGSNDTKGAIEVFESASDPSAPSANGARLFAKDNGAGKTQLCVRFNTGATQCFATEP